MRMTEEPVNFTIEYLRAIRAENKKTHEMLFDIVERLGSLETKIVYFEHRMASMGGDIARLDGRLDRIDKRLDRIEKRLDLVEA